MSRTIYSTVACAVLASSLAAFSAQAMPFSAPGAQQSDATLVAGGCGPGFHRGPFNGCVANGPVVIGPAVVIAPPVVVAPAIVAPGVVVAPAVVCGAGFRWHPRFRRCVIL
jgi:hypothetical protein